MKKFYPILVSVVIATALIASLASGAVVNGPVASKLNGPATKQTGVLFANWTGRLSTERFYGDVIDVRGWNHLTLMWRGITSFSNYTGIQGTFIVYASRNSTGPWSPIYVSTTKQSFTADGAIHLDVAGYNYVAVSFNRTRNGLHLEYGVSNTK